VLRLRGSGPSLARAFHNPAVTGATSLASHASTHLANGMSGRSQGHGQLYVGKDTGFVVCGEGRVKDDEGHFYTGM